MSSEALESRRPMDWRVEREEWMESRVCLRRRLEWSIVGGGGRRGLRGRASARREKECEPAKSSRFRAIADGNVVTKDRIFVMYHNHKAKRVQKGLALILAPALDPQLPVSLLVLRRSTKLVPRIGTLLLLLLHLLEDGGSGVEETACRGSAAVEGERRGKKEDVISWKLKDVSKVKREGTGAIQIQSGMWTYAKHLGVLANRLRAQLHPMQEEEGRCQQEQERKSLIQTERKKNIRGIEEMTTLGDDRVGELLPADETGERDVLLLLRVFASESFGSKRILVLLVELPTGKVVASL
jgi:hypothetical protein